MKLFKKKYTRSDWFKGLLEAEDMMKAGYSYEEHAGSYVWFYTKDGCGFIGIPVNKSERCAGIRDYVLYNRNYLNKIE